MTATTSAIDWRADSRIGGRHRDRSLPIDTMRGIAIVMVIGIHSLAADGSSPALTAIDAILRPCVPVFLFASGFLSAQATHIPVLTRIRRVLGPYTIAFIAAYAFMAWRNPSMDQRLVVTLARYGLAYVFVYYYVFVYVGCMIMLWLVYAAAACGQRNRRQSLVLLLSLAIVVGLTFGAYLDPLLRRAGIAGSIVEEVRMRDVPFWFGFVALGALTGLLGGQAVLHRSRHLLVGLTVGAYLVYAAIRVSGLGDAADYDSLPFFLYSALFCLTLLAFSPRWATLGFLGAASYFIYLWHIFVILLLRDVLALHELSAASVAIEFAAALAVSALLAGVIRRSVPAAQWLGAS
jgi:surface polysaccharide O-acyltransferase-like enzyme